MPLPAREPPKLYTVSEVCQILKLRKSAVYSKLGVSLECYRLPAIRVSQEQLNRYLETVKNWPRPTPRASAKASPPFGERKTWF